MIRKSLIIAVIFFGFVAVANAQTPVGGATPGTAPITTGWNYLHAAYCLGYYDGTNTWLYLYGTDGSAWWTQSNILINQPFLQMMELGCQTGNWIAFYVYNAAGNWNYTAAWPFK